MEQPTLFEDQISAGPLASRLRPQTLGEFEGQRHLLAEGKILRRLIDRGIVTSGPGRKENL